MMINFLGILLVFSSLCPVEGTYCVIPNSLRHRIIGIWSPVKIPYKSSAQKTWREPKFWPGGTKNIKPSYETRVPYNIKDERSRYSIYAGHAIIVDCNSHIYGSKQFYIKTFLCNHYNSFYDKDCTSPSDAINSYTNNVNVLQATYMSVPDAVQYCKNNGGELATISSEYENDLALKAMSIRNVKSALIGFTDSNRFGTWEGTWKWMNNALVTYTNWYEDKNNNDWDQPNNYGIGEHHTMITLSQRGQYGKWFDVGPPRTDNVHIFPFNRAPFFCTLKSIGPRGSKKRLKFRVFTETTASGWAWDVKRVRVFDETGSEVQVHDWFDSGSVADVDPVKYDGYHVRHAFSDNANWWGGRKDEVEGVFYLGGSVILNLHTHPTVVIEQFGTHIVKSGGAKVLLQTQDPLLGGWVAQSEFEFGVSELVGVENGSCKIKVVKYLPSYALTLEKSLGKLVTTSVDNVYLEKDNETCHVIEVLVG